MSAPLRVVSVRYGDYGNGSASPSRIVKRRSTVTGPGARPSLIRRNTVARQQPVTQRKSVLYDAIDSLESRSDHIDTILSVSPMDHISDFGQLLPGRGSGLDRQFNIIEALLQYQTLIKEHGIDPPVPDDDDGVQLKDCEAYNYDIRLLIELGNWTINNLSEVMQECNDLKADGEASAEKMVELENRLVELKEELDHTESACESFEHQVRDIMALRDECEEDRAALGQENIRLKKENHELKETEADLLARNEENTVEIGQLTDKLSLMKGRLNRQNSNTSFRFNGTGEDSNMSTGSTSDSHSHCRHTDTHTDTAKPDDTNKLALALAIAEKQMMMKAVSFLQAELATVSELNETLTTEVREYKEVALEARDRLELLEAEKVNYIPSINESYGDSPFMSNSSTVNKNITRIPDLDNEDEDSDCEYSTPSNKLSFDDDSDIRAALSSTIKSFPELNTPMKDTDIEPLPVRAVAPQPLVPTASHTDTDEAKASATHQQLAQQDKERKASSSHQASEHSEMQQDTTPIKSSRRVSILENAGVDVSCLVEMADSQAVNVLNVSDASKECGDQTGANIRPSTTDAGGALRIIAVESTDQVTTDAQEPTKGVNMDNNHDLGTAEALYDTSVGVITKTPHEDAPTSVVTTPVRIIPKHKTARTTPPNPVTRQEAVVAFYTLDDDIGTATSALGLTGHLQKANDLAGMMSKQGPTEELTSTSRTVIVANTEIRQKSDNSLSDNTTTITKTSNEKGKRSSATSTRSSMVEVRGSGSGGRRVSDANSNMGVDRDARLRNSSQESATVSAHDYPQAERKTRRVSKSRQYSQPDSHNNTIDENRISTHVSPGTFELTGDPNARPPPWEKMRPASMLSMNSFMAPNVEDVVRQQLKENGGDGSAVVYDSHTDGTISAQSNATAHRCESDMPELELWMMTVMKGDWFLKPGAFGRKQKRFIIANPFNRTITWAKQRGDVSKKCTARMAEVQKVRMIDVCGKDYVLKIETNRQSLILITQTKEVALTWAQALLAMTKGEFSPKVGMKISQDSHDILCHASV
ncbi:hypothetical protein SARC_08556 [Sphaeroforma arctica JP610]|uniref:Uncharacterized protein n=1 Tax=Sphaeroforma arctica JP610 TaxID=667725 RepID=A0A0L0FQI7_9EUKA|nr:hypothetical protein SARC_08556 [Sphaeroforma arctica JP610]KNC79042.1 hypothetical protein SARC_08556 [Sphaeroforma arctica JP610]|eukprot:XP_014152944.1 hypothetical protein SARC_08556 [Sphaeroforma arctica JP610]